ncbi:unnamed protein product (macronuclear) [Paramecium tetraurelia]|uniref:Nucleosome assembly protein n=1 Tax=Paramecium tetraurelia TaxID=5888 RepID=A0DEH5_PARTE|nr:uncharacterized protein GSPATT00016268001 [Paramecium tetraurelia]CAK81442.1 unnamed protein product [Paramecium tetraurelia]|eukprot:XP_001448839.1 hypothetical protein (macronuclear) [Paramecium tetraurelia strain d4-2]
MEGGAQPTTNEAKEGHELHVQTLENKIRELPLKDRLKAIAIQHHYLQKEKLDKECEEKIHALQKQYDIKSLPIYAEQQSLINGQRAVSAEEQELFKEFFSEAELQEAQQIAQKAEPIENLLGNCLNKLRQFISCLWREGQGHPQILNLNSDTEVFTLRFTFKDNEHFKNKELTKKFIIEEGKDFPTSTVGTVIEWNEGKDVTVKIVEKKQKNKKTGASRTIKKKETQLSFFNFFKNSEDKDEGEEEGKAGNIDEDYEIGKTIAEEVIPYSLEYFLGINPDDEDYEDVDEDEDDEDDEDEEDDDDEGDDKKKKSQRKKSGDSKKSDKDKKGKAEKPECKQQ